MCSGWPTAMMKSVSGWNHIPSIVSSSPECFLNPDDIHVYIHCVRYFFKIVMRCIVYCFLAIRTELVKDVWFHITQGGAILWSTDGMQAR
jgi:hypothetical protein